MFLGDFHTHTRFSDGRLDLPDLIDLYGQRGFGALAVTDHICEIHHWLGQSAKWLNRTLTPESFPHYIESLKEQMERAWQQYKMVVLPGFEITKNSTDPQDSAHILVLGVTEWISPDLPVPEILKKVHELGGLNVAAHPVSTRKFEPQTYYLWNHREELAPYFDAWEVASGPFLFDEVHQSELPVLANSDLHHPRQINSWKTRFDCEKHPEAILNAIGDQELELVFYKERQAVFEPLRSSVWSWLSL